MRDETEILDTFVVSGDTKVLKERLQRDKSYNRNYTGFLCIYEKFKYFKKYRRHRYLKLYKMCIGN